MSKSTPSEPSVRDELSANRIDLRWKQPRPIMAPTGTIRTSAPPVMKAPPTDGCDNRARQSPTTSLVRHFTNDPQTRSPATASHRAPPHRTPRITHAHHTHTDTDLSLSSPGVEMSYATGVASPTPKRASAPQKGRHATQPNRKPERGRVLRPPGSRPWDTHTHTDKTLLRTARILETTAVHSLSSYSPCSQPPFSTHQRSGFCRPVTVAEPDDPGFHRSRRAPHRSPNTTTIAPQGRALSVDL